MKVGDGAEKSIHTIRVQGIGAGGVGVGELTSGKVVFIPRTAPGDLVKVALTRERNRWARGRIVELLEAGPDRVPPPCTRYQECDGCALQHLAYPRQLFWKGRIVGDALRRIGGLEVADPTVEPSPREVRYRNKVAFTLRRLPQGRVVAGFRTLEDRKRIMDVGAECLLPEDGLARIWNGLREGWGEGASLLPAGKEIRLTLRTGDGEAWLLVKGGGGKGDPEGLLGAVPGLAGVWREGAKGGPRHLAGREEHTLHWLGEDTELRGGAFLQTNREVGQALHAFILSALGDRPGERVIDGYCGLGVLGRALARTGARVVGVEADGDAVAEARKRAPEGQEIFQGRVEDLLPRLLPAELALLNPPRGGLAPALPGLLREGGVGEMVYVSCDPATLARDLKRMGEGFGITRIRSFDLFPQTSHVETVVFLQRGGV